MKIEATIAMATIAIEAPRADSGPEITGSVATTIRVPNPSPTRALTRSTSIWRVKKRPAQPAATACIRV